MDTTIISRQVTVAGDTYGLMGTEILMNKKIALIDVDGTGFPNLALMKISAWHKKQGDLVEMINPLKRYDTVYQSKVFTEEYFPDIWYTPMADNVIRGGTGYGLDNALPEEIEHIYPDYDLYGEKTQDTAMGFLTRGCPRGCDFCIVAEKEGRKSCKVADLSEWWHGQKHITLMDPNILASKDSVDLLGQLADSKAMVDINQGLDCRIIKPEQIEQINRIKLKNIHFAWDKMSDSGRVLEGLKTYKELATRKVNKGYGTVYVLVNYDTSMEENLFRVYTLRDMGYDPYIMVFDKPNASKEIKRLQRWVNAKPIFMTTPRFEDYKR